MAELTSDIEQELRKKVVGELRTIRDTELPTSSADWDLVWVLSGPETTFEENNNRGRNETRERFETGLQLVREVVAKRLSRQPRDIMPSDIREHGLPVYFNGTNEHNKYLKNFVKSGELEEKYFFPRELLRIAPIDQGILHTGHQFEMFPSELLEGKRKVVVVTSARHIPRARRYVGLSSNPFATFDKNNIIFYPAQPLSFPLSTREEVQKIPDYLQKGILVQENKK